MGSSSGPALASSHVPALSLGQDLVLAEGSPFDFGQFLDRFYLSRVGVRVLMGQVCVGGGLGLVRGLGCRV